MSEDQIINLLLIGGALVATAILASYRLGYLEGHREGYRKGQNANHHDGWIEEARWWRRNSVGVVEAAERNHEDEEGDE